MMVLAWLAVPLVATLFAIAWAHWSARPRSPEQPADSVAAYERFRAALGGPVPQQRSRRRVR